LKRFGHLFPEITSFANLFSAAQKAKKGKQLTPAISLFHISLEKGLFKLQSELYSKSYKPGAYKTFFIYDPKKRLISAAPFRDRIVHHALCNVIEPLFEKRFIFDSYANRKGKGTHKAIQRSQAFCRRYKYVLKCDIRKFFPSIDHEILKIALRKRLKCKDTFWLIDTIIDYSNPQEAHNHWFAGDNLFSPIERRKGLPIGNLTSQFWGNVYLDRFDHFVKEELQVPGYVRYVDDFVLFGNCKSQLKIWKNEVMGFLETLRMILHPHKSQIHRTENGLPFLGFSVYPNYRCVRKEKVKRFRRHLRKTLTRKNAGKISPEQLEHQLNAWLGHIRFGQSERLEYNVFWYLQRNGVKLFKHPRGSWRVLEQQ